MKIIVVGVGYVGLVTGVMLSYCGHEVICIDNNKEKISQLNNFNKSIISCKENDEFYNNNELPIYEPGLHKYLESSNKNNKIVFIDQGNKEISNADVAFIAVGTPSKDDGGVDLQYVIEAIDNLVKFLDPKCLIIIKSTVPPGTSNSIKKYLFSKGYNFEMASNPEFLREGSAVEDFLNPDRIIAGITSDYAKQKFKQIYSVFLKKDIPLIFTDLNTSELIKYASNAFLSLKVAFINELSDICEKVDADITQLALGVGSDKRIGENFLKPGPGFGGSCFPKDVRGLLDIVKKNDSESFILKAILSANNVRPKNMVKKLQKILGEVLGNKKLCILGLTFKANTDDIRDSPSIEIIKLLIDLDVNIVVYDPQGMKNAQELNLKVAYMNNPNQGIKGADAILILTEWEEFKHLDFDYAIQNMNTPIIIDLRNILNAEIVKDKGFKYYQLGKKYI